MSQAAGVRQGIGKNLAEWLDGLRGQDRYFKAQAAIVAAWLAISISTIVAVSIGGGSDNKLGAAVRAESAIGGTMLLITNSSDEDWTDVTYTLNGIYIARQAALAHRDHA